MLPALPLCKLKERCNTAALPHLPPTTMGTAQLRAEHDLPLKRHKFPA